VGPVIGGSWKGIHYMRSIPQSVHNPRTQKQTAQRSKFTVAVQTLKPLKSILNIAWKENTNQKSPFNAAMSYTLKNAVIQQDGNYVIDYASFCVSRGTLTPAIGASAAMEQRVLRLLWDDNSGSGNAAATDRSLIAILNPQRAEAMIFTEGTIERGGGNESIIMPTEWAGEEVQIYLGFISADGKNTSNSVYLGSQTV
jgi:hypothetical protein